MSLFSPNTKWKPPPTPFGGFIDGKPAQTAPHLLVSGVSGSGKALAVSTPIPTPDGFKRMGDIREGDTVFGRDGLPYKVTEAFDVIEQPDLYRLELSDGQSIVCDKEHLWIVSGFFDRNRHRMAKRRKALQRYAEAHAFASELDDAEREVADGHTQLNNVDTLLDAFVPSWRSFFTSTQGVKTALDQTNTPFTMEPTRFPRRYDGKPTQLVTGRPGRSYENKVLLRGLATRLRERYAVKPNDKAVEQVLTVPEMLSEGLRDGRNGVQWAIRLPRALQLPTVDLPVDPYVLGVWLADGSLHRTDLSQDSSNADEDGKSDMDHLTAKLSGLGFPTSGSDGNTVHVPNKLLKEQLEEIGVLHRKHIPPSYLRSSKEQRLALLQGLMDCDGTVSTVGGCDIGFSDRALIDDTLSLVRSLGIKASVSYNKRKRYTASDGTKQQGKPHHTVSFTTTENVFTLPRKADRLPEKTRETQKWLYVNEAYPILPGHPDYEPARCIAVASPDHSFLAGKGFIPTHNSRRVLGPGILMWKGPVVAVSSKPDLIDMTLEQRAVPGRTFVLDLSGEVPSDVLPAGVTKVVVDPTALVKTEDDALDMATVLMQSGSAGAGGGNNKGGGDPFWENISTAPLAALILAAYKMTAPGVRGIDWLRTAISRMDSEDAGAGKTAKDPSWQTAVEVLGENNVLAQKLLSVYGLDDKMRDSIRITMESAIAPWLRSTVAGDGSEKIFVPKMLEHPNATLYIVAPATGVAAGAAVSAVDVISKRWRANQTEVTPLPRLLLVVDELTNTMPWPKLPTVVTESRAMGIHLLVAVQATSQFAKRYGKEGMEELREVFPSTLILVGAPEKEMLENASWWAGKSERMKTSIDHAGRQSQSAERVATLEAVDLLPRSIDEGRLLRGSRPGASGTVNEAGLLVDLYDISQIRFNKPQKAS